MNKKRQKFSVSGLRSSMTASVYMSDLSQKFVSSINLKFTDLLDTKYRMLADYENCEGPPAQVRLCSPHRLPISRTLGLFY